MMNVECRNQSGVKFKLRDFFILHFYFCIFPR